MVAVIDGHLGLFLDIVNIGFFCVGLGTAGRRTDEEKWVIL